MRLPLTLKICAGALFLAVLQAVIAISAFRALQSSPEPSDGQQQQIVSTLARMQVSLAALGSREDLLQAGEGMGVVPFAEYHQRQLQAALEHLAAEGVGGAPVQLRLNLDGYVAAMKELANRQQGPAEETVGSPVSSLRQQRSELEEGLRALQEKNQESRQLRTVVVAKNRESSALLLLILASLGTVLGVGASLLVARRVATSLGRLSYATTVISEGAFDAVPQVDSNDELGDLAAGLGVMAQKLKNYEQICLDASPLTRLPGNIAIERALNDRLRVGEKFALCYVDLDNFKAYNDRYGYANGSEIIKETGEILYDSCRKHGRIEDFVGHIGGDDFVLITSPDLVPAVCEAIIEAFDRMILGYYNPEDLQRGYIEAIDRYGTPRQFPLMTLSIAVVSDDKRQISSPQEIAQVASEIKDFVKAIPGSNYLIDRRRGVRS